MVQEIILRVWGVGLKRVLSPEQIFSCSCGNCITLCIRLFVYTQMKLRRKALCSDCIFMFLKLDDEIT